MQLFAKMTLQTAEAVMPQLTGMTLQIAEAVMPTAYRYVLHCGLEYPITEPFGLGMTRKQWGFEFQTFLPFKF